jgi:dihydrolipoamide dehydrogenase
MKILTGTGVDGITTTATGVKAKIKGKDGKVTEEDFSHVIVAVGVVANTENIGLEEVGIKTERGIIAIDDMAAPP